MAAPADAANFENVVMINGLIPRSIASGGRVLK